VTRGSTFDQEVPQVEDDIHAVRQLSYDLILEKFGWLRVSNTDIMVLLFRRSEWIRVQIS